MAKKALLIILDGWGIGNHTKSDAISSRMINNAFFAIINMYAYCSCFVSL